MLTHLGFVDDTVLITETTNYLRMMLSQTARTKKKKDKRNLFIIIIFLYNSHYMIYEDFHLSIEQIRLD